MLCAIGVDVSGGTGDSFEDRLVSMSSLPEDAELEEVEDVMCSSLSSLSTSGHVDIMSVSGGPPPRC